MIWRILLVIFLFAGCTTVTPAIRKAIDVTTCRLDMYIRDDVLLTDAQKATRLALNRELREAVGILHDEGCPNYGR